MARTALSVPDARLPVAIPFASLRKQTATADCFNRPDRITLGREPVLKAKGASPRAGKKNNGFHDRKTAFMPFGFFER